MSFSLFFKPILDMFYWLPELDVALMLLLILVGFAQPQTLRSLRPMRMDFIILTMAVLFLLSFFRDMRGTAQFVKIESAFLLYGIGRLSFLKFPKTLRAIRRSFGVVLIVVGVYYFTDSGFKEWGEVMTFVGPYFFKTDLAIAMTQTMIFLLFAASARHSRMTIVPVAICLFFVLLSNARIYYFVDAIILVVVFLHYREGKGGARWRITLKTGALFVLVMIGGVFALNYLSHTFLSDRFLLIEVNTISDLGNEANTQGRSVVWARILGHFFAQDFWTQFWGLDLFSDGILGVICDSHNVYIKVLYATGFLGGAVFLLFLFENIRILNRVRARNLYYTTLSLFVSFLLAGLSAIVLEYTQQTWIYMFLLGVCVSEITSSTSESILRNKVLYAR